jgi:hypothetical protein
MKINNWVIGGLVALSAASGYDAYNTYYNYPFEASIYNLNNPDSARVYESDQINFHRKVTNEAAISILSSTLAFILMYTKKSLRKVEEQERLGIQVTSRKKGFRI